MKMKKIMLTLLVVVLTIVSVNAQTFGVKAGFISANAKVKGGGITLTDTESGFSVGLLAEFKLSDSIDLVPELLYVNDGESALQMPIMAKFRIGEGFSILVGPQITYYVEESVPDVTNFNIGLGAGVGYDLSDNFFIDAKYTLQLNNTYTGSSDFTAKANYLNIGLGYRFN
jgi:opacity protein-like surface antigen